MTALPPSTTGHPTEWAVMVKSKPKAPVSVAVNGAIEWADAPASKARA